MNITGISLWGDSIGKGVIYDETRGRYAIYTENLFSELKRRLKIPVENYAFMGATAVSGIERMEKATLREGSIAVIEYGGNDCDMPWKDIAKSPDGDYDPNVSVDAFNDAMLRMIDKARTDGAIPVLVTPPPLDADRYFNWISRDLSAVNIMEYLGDVQYIYRWQEHYANQVRRIARECNCILCDVRDQFLYRRNAGKLLGVDGIHPNESGYALINEYGMERLDEHFGLVIA